MPNGNADVVAVGGQLPHWPVAARTLHRPSETNVRDARSIVERRCAGNAPVELSHVALGQCFTCRYLNLCENNFTGQIPKDVAKLVNLTGLGLGAFTA